MGAWAGPGRAKAPPDRAIPRFRSRSTGGCATDGPFRERGSVTLPHGASDFRHHRGRAALAYLPHRLLSRSRFRLSLPRHAGRLSGGRALGGDRPCSPEGPADARPASAPLLQHLHDNRLVLAFEGRDGEAYIFTVILISWGIALIEYCFAVPANRLGYAKRLVGRPAQDRAGGDHAPRVRGASWWLVLGEPLHWRHFAAFACIMAAVGFLFIGK